MMPTKIEWCEEVWNIVTGCTPISEGCKNCYAKRMAQRLKGRFGYPKDNPFRVTFHPDKLEEPIYWKKPRRIFVVSMGDLFHEDVEQYMLELIFAEILHEGFSRHTFMILTKRPERMRVFLSSIKSLPSNLWLGVSVSNQADADRWIPILLQIPAAKRFVSYEPALGPVDFESFQPFTSKLNPKNSLRAAMGILSGKLDLIIAGGESGPGARPAHPDWFRRVRDDCAAAGVPFFFKQLGEWMCFRPSSYGHYVAAAGESWDGWKPHHRMLTMFDKRHPCPEWLNNPYDRDNLSLWGNVARVGKKAAGRELDGVIHDGWPGSEI